MNGSSSKQTTIFLLVPAILLLAMPNVAGDTTSELSGLVLSQRHEILFPEPEPISRALRWILAEPLVVTSDQGAIILVPQAPEQRVRPRPEHGMPERKFRVARINLRTGEAEHWRDLNFRLRENFGLGASADGRFTCTIADGEFLVLDERLEIRARIPANPPVSTPGDLGGRRCNFFSDSGRVLLLFRGDVYLKAITPSTLMIWKWREGILHAPLLFDTYVWDVRPVARNLAMLIDIKPEFYYRHRAAVIPLEEPAGRPLWKKEIHENGRQLLRIVGRNAYRGEWNEDIPSDHIRIAPPSLDQAELPDLTRHPSPSLIARIRSWELNSGKKGPEFSMKNYDLMWPLAVSEDERWLACRAVHFTHFDATNQFLWDDNRFVIFDTRRPKKPIFVSDNFGPEEALTGLAFTPDRKTLVVSTTGRLLIYDIKEGSDTNRK